MRDGELFTCRFCGGDATAPDHPRFCDGRQGWQDDFDGDTYDRPRDRDRLFAQLGRVRVVFSDHAWHTLAEVSALTGDPQASISARIRDLRKAKFGAAIVERRYIDRGLWEYRLVPAPVAVVRETDSRTGVRG